MPLLQLYENISSIYFLNYVQTFIAESLKLKASPTRQQLIGMMMKWFLMFLLS